MKVITNWRDAEVPSLTETYSPVAHSELIYLLEKQLNLDGYQVVNNSVNQSYDGDQIAGTMKLNKDTGIAGNEMSQTLAYQNSYNKRLPIRIVSGGEVWICSNGMIVGDIITFRKHTGDVFPALKELIALSITRMEEDYEKTQRDVIVMKETELTTKLAAELIGRMYVEEQILSSTEVNEVVRQWRKPKFEDFKPNNLWSLYNAATFAMKEATPERQMTSLKALHEFSMDAAAELGAYV
jgi:hypothetical protein